MPFAFVEDVVGENEPPFVADQATARPEVFMKLLLASASCTVSVTAVPATTLELLDVTRYLAAGPATVVINTLPTTVPVVAVTECATPAVVLVVNSTVAIPLA